MSSIIRGTTMSVRRISSLPRLEPSRSTRISSEASQLNKRANSPSDEREQIISTARAEAEKLLQEAKEKVEQLITQAQIDIQRMQAEAVSRAETEGREAGLASARAEMAGKVALAASIAQSAINEKRDLLIQAESELAQLSLAIAQKIIGQETSLSQDTLKNIIQQSLNLLSKQQAAVIHLNPGDIEAFSEYWQELSKSSASAQDWQVLADPAVSTGGCVIETKPGVITGSVQTQIGEITQAFSTINPAIQQVTAVDAPEQMLKAYYEQADKTDTESLEKSDNEEFEA